MTSTTKWRGRASDISYNQKSPRSPRRPSLSPTPLPSSPVRSQRGWYTAAADGDSDGYGTTGLGLWGASLSRKSSQIVKPDHIYIDQYGGAHVGPRSQSAHRGSTDRHHTEARKNGSNTKSGKRKNHTRSGSTIDDLANAAIATSPRFSAVSPSYTYATSPSTHVGRPASSHTNGFGIGEPLHDRPAKRIKSEKLNAAEWSQNEERPRTSHASDYQSPRPEEAELLLGLRYAWGTQASPSITSAVLSYEKLTENLQPAFEESIAPQQLTPHDISIDNQNISDQTGDGVQEIAEQIQSSDHSEDQEVKANTLDALNADMDVDSSELKPILEASNGTLPESIDNITKHEANSVKDGRQPAKDESTSQEADASEPSTQAVASKKPRKIQPEVQAEVCASCMKLQRDGNGEDMTTQWIGCEHCKKWFHAACVGLRDKSEARSVDKFYCDECEGKFGTTTFVRKSSRTRTAIDYAGLNQGVVKPSDESSMHHYIQPIKDHRIRYLPDDFARIRPELMTMEFWENMDGMKRPFVVPACWNPRFGVAPDPDDAKVDTIESEPMSSSSFRYIDSNGEELPAINAVSSTSRSNHDNEQATEEVVDTDQDYLDMVMPRSLTVRKVADLYGPEQPVPVIDVKSQETKGQFTLADWADYYEQQGDKPIRNVISLEVSNSRLGRLIRRPKVVRDIDLEDHVWDNETRSTSNKRPVQYYCLMSVADSYTDFHIDFGGSSVYYHILKGVKTFFFIPPEDKYLKKYEEWCNSDTQNDTWLGDLCGGNVTRVDLHEGDTAFIPAGWIHSVWTPEDSLVIGGNFLTRLDYELQLKVANIEKTTRVPLKFRYPFFQKVMWYSLLKYLEDDPVPEEVLCAFHEDDDYRFLRANPIYIEDCDTLNLAEPGDSAYNARTYPKSELKGLPALRDYLYRTARIYADLPVPDINKRQTDAVKASIPKGHGDPMQLIKTFAVWCAWKIGNEPVPEWVHTDFGGLLPEIAEREKQRKAETFRVPPERVSARKAQQSRTTSSNDETHSPLVNPVQTPDSDDSSKRRNAARLSGTRVACDACRKRRIKCRHKEGDASPVSTSPAAIRPRAYSNASVDVLKLPSASPVTNGVELAVNINNSMLSDFSSTDLAQAALATLHSQSSDPTSMLSNATPVSASKKGRSKACEECRKSKRRCVHDEFGRVDPAKAAEPSKPRGSANAKRAARSSDDSALKKLKMEPEIDPMLLANPSNEISDALIDPALMGQSFTGSMFADEPHPHQQSDYPANYPEPAAHRMPHDDPNNIFLDHGHMHDHFQADSGYPVPVVADDNAAVVPEVPAQVALLRQTPEHDVSYSPITVDGNVADAADRTDVLINSMEEPTRFSRHSSRTPRHIDRFVPEDHRPLSKTLPKPAKSTRRGSSEGSGHTGPSTIKSSRSSSNTSGTTHQAAASVLRRQPSQEVTGRPVSRGSVVESEVDADEKLARELQAAENGLRRRASVRA